MRMVFYGTVLPGSCSLPLMFVSFFVSEKKHDWFLKSNFNQVLTFLFTLTYSFIAFSEIIFWREFHSRFNFIAVDYLIYTNEVLTNLSESFPMGILITTVAAISLVLTYLSNLIPFSAWNRRPLLQKSVSVILMGLVLPSFFFFGIGPWLEFHNEDFHNDQLSRNGVVEFVRAFRSNKIDYRSFYSTILDEKAQRIYKKKIVIQNEHLDAIKTKPNIVFIAVESLGAKFIGPLNKTNKDLTPYLNKLSSQSLFFDHFYATGTRTVRGLEALTLSVPPTPGFSVVKRPNHDNLYSMGHTFKQNGYDPVFLYGGRGFFDNMNAFFSSNGFEVVDQGDFSKERITFSNAWGVCDEDLFGKAQELISNRTSEKPFLLFMLTTSNHRPFTYPDGKIDIKSGTSRAGAVKYTDYAIGTFLERAQKEPWSKKTIFVIVADHSTEGRGQFDLAMNDFHIPLWIYAPGLIEPRVISKISSQIDLLPSLIHLLNLKDDSPFFGRSMFNPEWKDERAFVGNYQYVGYYRDQVLTTLGPNQIIRNYSWNPETKVQVALKDSAFIDEAVTYYQLASDKLDSGKYKAIK